MPTRVIAEWMAQQWRDGQRVKRKLGIYPFLSLDEARDVFKRDFAKDIQSGRNIKFTRESRPGTVGELFEAYVEALKRADKPSWEDIEKCLKRVSNALGRNRPACEIQTEEIVEVLRPIYNRGAKGMADHVRSYVRAAFSWGMRSEIDYRQSTARRFRILHNPAAGIPTETKIPGTRWLRENEFVRLYRWLDCPSSPVHPSYPRAIQLLMLTGQRVQEIARLHVDQWDERDQILDWSTTKNDQPHAIPLPSIASDLMLSITPNQFGWFFPSAKDPSRPVDHTTLYSFTWRHRDQGLIPHATNRDLRRTWKTLAGKAGVSKEIRDRIQNHALRDVSSRHYDRWNYMREKREAMDIWDGFVRDLLNGIGRNASPPRVQRDQSSPLLLS
jgi:integrase